MNVIIFEVETFGVPIAKSDQASSSLMKNFSDYVKECFGITIQIRKRTFTT